MRSRRRRAAQAGRAGGAAPARAHGRPGPPPARSRTDGRPAGRSRRSARVRWWVRGRRTPQPRPVGQGDENADRVPVRDTHQHRAGARPPTGLGARRRSPRSALPRSRRGCVRRGARRGTRPTGGSWWRTPGPRAWSCSPAAWTRPARAPRPAPSSRPIPEAPRCRVHPVRRAQPSESSRRLGLDRSGRAPEQVGPHCLAAPLGVAQHDDRSLAHRQPGRAGRRWLRRRGPRRR